MPVIPIPPAIPDTRMVPSVASGVQAGRSTQKTPPAPLPDFVTTWKTQDIDPVRQVIVYSNGVTATLAPSVLTCDRLEVHNAPDEQYAIATGNVKLNDPDAFMTADRMEFNWHERFGNGDHVYVKVGEYQVWADHVEIQPERVVTTTDVKGKTHKKTLPARWTLTGVTAEGCAKPLPDYQFRTRTVIVEPGVSATAYHPVLYVGGHRIIQLPTQRISLNRRDQGIGFPTPSLNRDGRFGTTWSGGYLLNDQTSFNFRTSVFQGRYPSGRLSFARSFVSQEENSNPIIPSSPFGERFSWGYFDSIRTESFFNEEQATRKPKATLALSSYWHVSPSARDQITYFDVPMEISFEKTFASHGWGLLGIARASSLHEVHDTTDYRVSTQWTLSPPRVKLGAGLFGVSRFDAASFDGANTNFLWARAQAGFIFQPNKTFSIGAVYYDSTSAGSPQFEMDPLVAKEGVNARVGFDFGSTKLGYLIKYDRGRGFVYDREYSIRQAVGCFDVFLDYRRFPSHYALGILLRVDPIFDRLHKRSLQRTQPLPAMPGMGDGKG